MGERKTAVIIKTSPGRPSLLWTLESVKQHFWQKKYRFYIADENPIDDWKVPIYKSLQREGHYVQIDEQGVSVGCARNKLIQQLQGEEQALRLDDDFELGGEFRLDAIECVLWGDPEIAFCSDRERQIGDGKGVLSGQVRPFGGDLVRKGNKIVKKFHGLFKPWKKVDYVSYRRANFTRNLLLIKTEVFDHVSWSEELRFIGEHVDFMLRIQEAGFWGAYCRDSTHMHRDDLTVYRGDIAHYRSPELKEDWKVYFKRRWGISEKTTSYGLDWYVYEGIRRLVVRC